MPSFAVLAYVRHPPKAKGLLDRRRVVVLSSASEKATTSGDSLQRNLRSLPRENFRDLWSLESQVVGGEKGLPGKQLFSTVNRAALSVVETDYPMPAGFRLVGYTFTGVTMYRSRGGKSQRSDFWECLARKNCFPSRGVSRHIHGSRGDVFLN